MPGEYELWSTVITRPVRRIAQAAVVTSLVAGAVGVSHLDKSVTLSVDGKASTVHAFGSTVGDILKKQDIAIREHDVVVPAPGTQVADGQKIVVRYGRKLTVTIDGAPRDYWTTATTVAAALQELGIRADSAKLSASRSMSLGRQGLVLSVTTPKTVVVRVDGKNRTATTTGATVADVLSELKITKDADDRVQPGPHHRRDRRPQDRRPARHLDADQGDPGRRDPGHQEEGRQPLRRPDQDAEARRRRCQDRHLQGGQGRRQVVESKKAVGHQVTQAPVGAVLAVGTKARPQHPSATPATRPAPASTCPTPPCGTGSPQCESGGNWSINTGNGYYGGLQFATSLVAGQRWRRLRPARRPRVPCRADHRGQPLLRQVRSRPVGLRARRLTLHHSPASGYVRPTRIEVFGHRMPGSRYLDCSGRAPRVGAMVEQSGFLGAAQIREIAAELGCARPSSGARTSSSTPTPSSASSGWPA